MVNQSVSIRDKWRKHKKIGKVLVVIIVIGIIIAGIFLYGFFSGKLRGSTFNVVRNQVVLENPLKNIVFANTNANGEVDRDAVVMEGIANFDETYINYLLLSLGVGSLSKSKLGYGNPVLEMVVGNEAWNSEIVNKALATKKGAIDNEDLRISISKQEAVNALLASDIKQFMKDSVSNGNTQIEMVAGKAELLSKGYLDMYNKLIG